ncbi:MAG: ribonuclease T2 [Acetobacteraceae bacterium]|nr:ribonuclease T2 [Acetobacteraceae bacterium]MBV8520621.1 ribonuclease T2 [Acetobacteraceae bacterium]
MSKMKILKALLVTGTLITLSTPAYAPSNQGRDNSVGKFDFYVLSLSWSPTFCQAPGNGAEKEGECGGEPRSFVVHGLWPESDRRFNESCVVPAPRLPRSIVDSMLDLMPSPRLIYHEWDTHGTCSGLSPAEYFNTVRKARAEINIPAEYADLHNESKVDPNDIRAAFIRANPDLEESSIAVECDGRLREVRICLSKDLRFRACPEIVEHSCHREAIVVPPIEGDR